MQHKKKGPNGRKDAAQQCLQARNWRVFGFGADLPSYKDGKEFRALTNPDIPLIWIGG